MNTTTATAVVATPSPSSPAATTYTIPKEFMREGKTLYSCQTFYPAIAERCCNWDVNAPVTDVPFTQGVYYAGTRTCETYNPTEFGDCVLCEVEEATGTLDDQAKFRCDPARAPSTAHFDPPVSTPTRTTLTPTPSTPTAFGGGDNGYGYPYGYNPFGSGRPRNPNGATARTSGMLSFVAVVGAAALAVLGTA